MTGRGKLLIGIGCGVLAAALLAGVAAMRIRNSAPMPRIGILGMDSGMQARRVGAFVDALRALGYVDGKNVVIEYRWAEGHFDRLPALATELAAAKMNVIVTAAPPAVRAAQQATGTVPIVMMVHDPVGMGFAKSLARPGGNITGVAFQDAELSTKRLSLLREAVPGLVRVAVLWNEEGSGPNTVKAVEAAARDLGMETLTLEVKVPADFATAIAAAKAWGAQGLIQLSSPFITKNRGALLPLFATYRIPATCELREYVVDGCLMTYSADINAMFRQLATFVDRVLKGTSVAESPIEQPREFQFVINKKTADTLGLTIPRSLEFQMTEPFL